MLDRILMINRNEYVLIYDNRTPITVYADNGFAINIVETLLSPRKNMTYSEYIRLEENIDEVTQPCYIITK